MIPHYIGNKSLNGSKKHYKAQDRATFLTLILQMSLYTDQYLISTFELGRQVSFK
ncbi:hypothetical protein FM107_04215 [Sphingobacterium sp. JB170]|nr:hypothetical protein FM107_04215 [Sphingobacterium sp. JB170]